MVKKANRIISTYRGGSKMENVIFLDKQTNTKACSKPNEMDNICEWDSIGEIFANAVKRKKLSNMQVNNMITKIKSEIRGK